MDAKMLQAMTRILTEFAATKFSANVVDRPLANAGRYCHVIFAEPEDWPYNPSG